MKSSRALIPRDGCSTSLTKSSSPARRPRSRPSASVDDHEIGAGPVTLELQKAYLDTVRGEVGALGPLARPRRGGRQDSPPRRESGHAADPALVARSSTSATRSSSLEVLRSGRLSLGPTIDRFEELFAERVGWPTRPPLRAGQSGLDLLCAPRRPAALRRRGRSRPRSRSSPRRTASIYAGATPVFADIDPRTLNLDTAMPSMRR